MQNEAMEDKNIFMICRELNLSALKKMEGDYHVRGLKEDELEEWKSIHFDSVAEKEKYYYIVDDYYNKYFRKRQKEFFSACKVICNNTDDILGTCFLWKTESNLYSIQWFKVKKRYVNRGIGRMLLSDILKTAVSFELPLILHTHPVSLSAIKLYTDFGFILLLDKYIGSRKNDLEESLPYLNEQLIGDMIETTYLLKNEKNALIIESQDF